jgi:hypothetical protein
MRRKLADSGLFWLALCLLLAYEAADKARAWRRRARRQARARSFQADMTARGALPDQLDKALHRNRKGKS